MEKKSLQLNKFDQSLNSVEKSILTYFLGIANPKIIIELGVYKGSTTKIMSEFLTINQIEFKIIGFDLENVTNGLVSNDEIIKQMVSEDKLELIGGLLPNTLKKYLKKTDKTIDFALIDAQHDYQSVLGELSDIWPYLSEGGFIICYD